MKGETEKKLSKLQKEYKSELVRINARDRSLDEKEKNLDTKEKANNEAYNLRKKELEEMNMMNYRIAYETSERKEEQNKVFKFYFIYCLFITIFIAFQSKIFKMDLFQFFIKLKDMLFYITIKFIDFLKIISKKGDDISQPIFSFIVHWIVPIILGIIIIFILIYVVYAMIILWFEWFTEEQADYISLAILMISFATIIFFGEYIKYILPINLILIILVINIISQIIRKCIY